MIGYRLMVLALIHYTTGSRVGTRGWRPKIQAVMGDLIITNRDRLLSAREWEGRLMERIERLASVLVAEKGFQRMDPDPGDLAAVEQIGLLAEPPPFGFVGTRRHWWQPTTIALVDADGLDLAGMERFAARFFALIYGQYSIAGTYGLLCFVFEGPPTPAIIEHVRNLKRSRYKVYMAAWTVDLSTGRVIPHRWGPFGVYPGRAYIEEAIRRS